MMARGWAVLIVAIALLHAGAYIAHQRVDWPNERIYSDRGEFELLAKNLLTYGRFTRYPNASPPVTESERAVGYPLFLAGVYTVFGTSRMTVALVHAVLFAALCLVVMRLGALAWSPGVGVAAGIAAALYPPFPYWAAMSLTEILTTLTLTSAIWFFLRGMRSKVALDFVLSGLAFGYLAITRPAWVLLAPGLAGLLMLLAWWRRDAVGLTLRRFVVMGGAMLLVVAPWAGFVYAHFHVVSLNPVAFWRTAYWGYWQGVFPGRVAVELDEVTDSVLQGDALTARLRRIGPDVERMRTYVEETRSITALWRDIPDESARADAKRGIEGASRAIILRHLREGDLWSFLYRRLTYGTFALWVADIPIRYSMINAAPVAVIRGIELGQAILLALCAAGVFVLLRADGVAGATMLLVLLYTEAVHVFIHTDIRFSLPAKPLVVLLAVVAVSRLAHARVLQSAASVRPATQRG